MMLIHKIKAPREIREKKTGSSGTGNVAGSSGSIKRPRATNSSPKKRKEDFGGSNDDKQREHQVDFRNRPLKLKLKQKLAV